MLITVNLGSLLALSAIGIVGVSSPLPLLLLALPLGLLIRFAKNHTFVALSETRSTRERYIMSEQQMPSTHIHFLGHLNHHSGGSLLAIEKVFLSSCSSFGCCSLDVDSRALYFWSDSEFGSLDVFAVYLDPADTTKQIQVLQLIRKRVRAGAHNIILGNFNFVFQGLDRVQDACVGAVSSPAAAT